ncbi:MAG: hypothetical protein AAF634_13730, partial [Bacteroidota bacterium]
YKLKVVYVKAPLSVIQQENQFSAKKELFQDLRTTRSSLEALVQKYAPGAAYEVVYGNLKNNVLEALSQNDPDIIVLGKQSRKLGGILGDRVIDTLLNSKSKASILIVDAAQPIPGSEKLSVGILKGNSATELGILESIFQNDAKQIRYFSIEDQTASVPRERNHFIFSKGSNAIANMIEYTVKTKTELFCIPRGMEARFPKKMLHKLKANVLLVR